MNKNKLVKEKPYKKFEAVAAGFNQPLCDAAGKGDLRGLRKIVASAATGQLGSAKSKVGRAALIRACKTGEASRDCARELLVRGAEPGCFDEEHGRTPLIYLASLTGGLSGRAALARLLLEVGADLETQDSKLHRSCLLWAAATGNSPFVRVCLEYGANVHAVDIKGMTALALACAAGHLGCVRQLIEAGSKLASLDYRTRRSPLEWAFVNGHAAICRLLWQAGSRLGADQVKECIESCLKWRNEEMLEMILGQLFEEQSQCAEEGKNEGESKFESDEIISNRPSQETSGCAMLVHALKCLSEMLSHASHGADPRAQELLEQCRTALIDCDQARSEKNADESGAFSNLLAKLRVRLEHLRIGSDNQDVLYDMFVGDGSESKCVVGVREHTISTISLDGYSLMDQQLGSALELLRDAWCQAVRQQENEIEEKRCYTSGELQILLATDTGEFEWDFDDPSDLILIKQRLDIWLGTTLRGEHLNTFLQAAREIIPIRLAPAHMREFDAQVELYGDHMRFTQVNSALWKGHVHVQAVQASTWLASSFLDQYGCDPKNLCWDNFRNHVLRNVKDLETWHDLGFLADLDDFQAELLPIISGKSGAQDTEECVKELVCAAVRAWHLRQDAELLFLICDNRVAKSVPALKINALFTQDNVDGLAADRYDFLNEQERRTRCQLSWLGGLRVYFESKEDAQGNLSQVNQRDFLRAVASNVNYP